jgi:hypothetical protein
MMEAARTSETMVKFYQTTRRYNPEDSHLRFSVICRIASFLLFLHGLGFQILSYSELILEHDKRYYSLDEGPPHLYLYHYKITQENTKECKGTTVLKGFRAHSPKASVAQDHVLPRIG